MYYPIRFNPFVEYWGSDTIVRLGKTNSNVSGQISGQLKVPMVKLLSFDVRSYKLGNFLDYAPYTTISLHVPYFEPIELQPEIAYKMSKIEVYMTMDLFNGKSTLYVEGTEIGSSNHVLLATKSTQIGIEVAVGKTNKEEQIRNNAIQSIGFIGSVGGLAVGVASGNPLVTAGSIGMMTKNATQFLSNNIDRMKSYKGSSGDRTALEVNKRTYLMIERPKNIKRPTPELKGRVLNETRTLNTISGYTEISDIHFNPFDRNITDKEINEIVELLRTGVIL
jgi:hypothetical protein